MKKILSTALVLCLPYLVVVAQNNKYASTWKDIEKYDSLGLPKTAFKLAEELNKQAFDEQNTNVYVKSLIYKMKLQSEYSENQLEQDIKDCSVAASKAFFPAKQLLNAILAQLYWHYYQIQRYDSYETSATVTDTATSIAIWSATAFAAKIIALNNASLEAPERLKKVPAYSISDILQCYETDSMLTLYDVLVTQIIDFYSKQELQQIRPIAAFSIKCSELLIPATDFVHLKIATTDTLSFKYQALLYYQWLLGAHMNDTDVSMFQKTDLCRIDFIRENATDDNKNEWYLNYLNNIDTTNSLSNKCNVLLHLAEYYFLSGNEWNDKENNARRWYLKQALQYCNAFLKYSASADSMQVGRCKEMLLQLHQQQLDITTERVIVSDKNFMVLVNYKNITALKFAIYSTNANEYDAFINGINPSSHPDSFVYKLRHFCESKQPIKNEHFILPQSGDFRQHSVALSLPALPLGLYIVLVGDTDQLNAPALAGQLVYVSDIAYMWRDLHTDTCELYVVNRKTGAPLADAEVKVLPQKYDYNTNNQTFTEYKTYKTNNAGKVNIATQHTFNSFYIDVRFKKDFISSKAYNNIWVNPNFYAYSVQNEPPRSQTFLFTDRALYKPGQTVYYKGIVVNMNNNNANSLNTNSEVDITFRNANNNEVAKHHHTTNDFGSFNGSFIIPENGLTGIMSMATDNGYLTVRVEAYKRPTFEVQFNAQKAQVRPGSAITAKGTVMSFAGASIAGAKVSYRVERSVLQPFWNRNMRMPFANIPEKEIKNGTCETNSAGEFEIQFIAETEKIPHSLVEPISSFTVSVDVTDISGETHSGAQTIAVSAQSMYLSITAAENIAIDSGFNCNIGASNIAGTALGVSGTFTIYKLQPTERMLRSSLWNNPDTFVYAKEAWIKLFPNDRYWNETDDVVQKDTEPVVTGQFETSPPSNVPNIVIPNTNNRWKPGKYMIELNATDSFGKPVTASQTFTLYGNEPTPPFPTDVWFVERSNIVEPGSNATYLLKTSYKKLTVLKEIEVNNKIISSEWLTCEGSTTINIPISEIYRGNIGLHVSWVNNNRFYAEDRTIHVPYTNKKLTIKFEAFRNKLEPGTKEQWKISIRDIQGKTSPTEIVAALYDASLDQMQPNKFVFNPYTYYFSHLNLSADNSFATMQCAAGNNSNYYYPVYSQPNSCGFNWFGYSAGDLFAATQMKMETEVASEMVMYDAVAVSANVSDAPPPAAPGNSRYAMDKQIMYKSSGMRVHSGKNGSFKGAGNTETIPRRNFQETAFFYPQLQTDKNGLVTVSFTIPEALTTWKMLGIAHTKDLKWGQVENSLTTQKSLMVEPLLPRFFRTSDTIEIKAKITNMSDKKLRGEASITLYNAADMVPLDSHTLLCPATQHFETETGKNQTATWKLYISEGLEAITYKIVAATDEFSDGEEATIPVLPNKLLVTETLPFAVRANQTKTFTLRTLKANTSATLRSQSLSLEYTTNPLWSAIQSLPYLMEYPDECAEQLFGRFYANSMSMLILNHNPEIQNVYQAWKNLSPEALVSNLEKNSELKSVMLEETPWVNDARNENASKHNMALLFDSNNMLHAQRTALDKLIAMQGASGGFPWFQGMPDNRYITQYILCGLAKMTHAGFSLTQRSDTLIGLEEKAIHYLDNELKTDFDNLVLNCKNKKDIYSTNNLNEIIINHLYTRSWYNNIPLADNCKEANEYYTAQCKKYWNATGIYCKAMLALVMNRLHEPGVAKAIIASLKEHAISSDETGTYWPEKKGWYWYQSPVETQCMLIEAFHEVSNDTTFINEMKLWLLQQKQHAYWGTSKATVEACYALFLTSTQKIATTLMPSIAVGNQHINFSDDLDKAPEQGSGYFKKSWSACEITPAMADISVQQRTQQCGYGGLYWSYLENISNILPSQTNITLTKKLFVQLNTNAGPINTPIDSGTTLHVGDIITVKLFIQTNIDLEFIHLKDMFASALEPIHVNSGYTWHGGLWYYTSTRNTATHFFIGRLPKGKYNIEYQYRVAHSGCFESGISTIQSMYAPEYSSHTGGEKILVK